MSNPSTLQCIIIEDNDVDREALIHYLRDYSFLHINASFSNPVEALEILNNSKIDLLFSDIDMPGISGIDFFKTLKNPPLCIFVTVHPEYAIEAFDVQAVDYIMKPIRIERLDKAIHRTLELMEIKSKALQYTINFEKDSLMIKEGTTSSKVFIGDILYLEALTNYTKVITEKKKYITLQNLKGFLEFLPKEKFVRIHRSYAVAIDKVEEVTASEIKIGGQALPLGKTYRQSVKNLVRM